MHPWHNQKGKGLSRWRRKSPATILLALLLVIGQVQFALAQIANTVTATGTHGGSTYSATADETVDVVDAAPVMVVNKTGTLNDDDGTPGLSAGDTITYEITADNTGNITLTGVVAVDFIAPLTFDAASDTNSDSRLDVDEIWRWTATYIVTQNDIDTNGGGDGDIDNTVRVFSNQLPPIDGVETVGLTPTPAMVVNKTGVLNDDDGTPGPSAGDTISYTVTVENTGNVNLTGVGVSDPLVTLTFDGNDAGSDGIVSPSEIWTYTGSYTLLQSDFDNNGGGDGDIDNTATVSSNELPDELATAETPILANSAVEIAKIADISGVTNPGDLITYTVTATNTGNVTLTNMVVNDPKLTPDTQTCASVLPGATCVLSGTYATTVVDFGTGSVDNTATVTTNEGPTDTVDVTTPLTSTPAMVLNKVGVLNDDDGTPGASAGDTISYSVTVENTGNVDLTSISVADPLVTLTFDGNDAGSDGVISPAEIWTYTGTYILLQSDFDNNGAGDGDIDNTATVSSAELPDQLGTAETPFAVNPAVDIAKTGDISGVSNPGDLITYTVTATNTGNVTLTNMVVNDPNLTPDTQVCASVLPGATCILTGTYTTTAVDFGIGSVDNTASVITDEGPTDTITITTPIISAPAFTVSKSGVLNDDDGVAGPSDGDTIDYTVTVINTGNVPLTNVVADDPLTGGVMTLASGDTNTNNQLDTDEIWIYSAQYILTVADMNSNGGGDGNIENTVTIETSELPDQTADAVIPLNLNPAWVLAKVGVLNDDDGNPGLTAGDTVTYTVSIENTGNIRLTNPVVSDPMVTLLYASGDTNSNSFIDVGETWNYTGTTIITQTDLDTLGGGDGDIDNTATVSSDQIPPEDVIHELPIAPVSSMDLTKSATTPVQLFPTIYEFTYTLEVENTGAVTQTAIRLQDDLVSAIAPATLFSTPIVAASGFTGTGGVNTGFDGSGNIELLAGDVQLAPGATATVTITLQIDTDGNTIDSLNTAYVSSDQTTTPIPSDDDLVTPGDPGDTNPTPVGIPDTDRDGSPDGTEGTGDRDGDGIPDDDDYDPTGYFYCQADGRILSGGQISVRNLTTGGVQTGIGTSNNITIVQDGSAGNYQFHVDAVGDYELFYTLPPASAASTSLLSSGTLDVSTRADNPAVIGSGEFGSSGIIADFTPASNPFYTRFSIDAGDPSVFNNNIPLGLCGTPALTAAKEVVSTSATQTVYRLRVESTGNEEVTNLQLTDDLVATFGAGNFGAPTAVFETTPAGFAGTLNGGYNGDGDTALLNAGATLSVGDVLTILLTVPTTAADGSYTNTVVATGDRAASSSATADIDILTTPSGLVIEKVATPSSAPIGAPVGYTIRVTNPGTIDINDVNIVDLIPNGMTYVPGSAVLDGVPTEPSIEAAQRIAPPHGSILEGHNSDPAPSGRELVWSGISIPAGDTVVITLTLVINASASGTEFVNLAFVRDVNGNVISNVARAKVRLEIEPVFQCSDLIGRVFDDQNRNGYHDAGEPGLPGVKLATAKGLLVTTDQFGRYHIACGAIPDADIGSNFIMKLDTRTLPTGYRVTTENPRVIRLTRGKLSKLNFGAANLRVVRVQLTDKSFVEGSERLTGNALKTLANVLPELDTEPSILRVVYKLDSDSRALAGGRLARVEKLLNQAWKSRQRVQALSIETSVTNQ